MLLKGHNRSTGTEWLYHVNEVFINIYLIYRNSWWIPDSYITPCIWGCVWLTEVCFISPFASLWQTGRCSEALGRPLPYLSKYPGFFFCSCAAPFLSNSSTLSPSPSFVFKVIPTPTASIVLPTSFYTPQLFSGSQPKSIFYTLSFSPLTLFLVLPSVLCDALFPADLACG